MGALQKTGQEKGLAHTPSLGRSHYGLACKIGLILVLGAITCFADTPPLKLIPLPKDADTVIAGTVNFEKTITDGIITLVTQVEPSMLQLGYILLGVFGCIAFLQSILRSQMSLMSSHHFVPMAMFVAAVAIMFRICIADIMMSFYATPIPGLGWNFHQIFPMIAQAMSNTVTSDTMATVLGAFNNVIAYIPTPGMLQVLPAIIFVMVIITVAVATVAMTIITVSSYCIVGVLSLVGPLMIPFYVLPGQDKRFWKWLDNMLVYSMYQFVGSCFIFLFCNAYVGFFTNLPGYSVAQWTVSIGMMILITASFAYTMFKVPEIAHMIFGGVGDVSGFANMLQGLVVKGVANLL